MKHYNIPIFIPHLGCPYNCIFCNQEKITSQSQPTSNLEIQEILVSHLHTIPASSAIVEAAFFGGNFTALPREEQKKYLQAVSSFIREGRIDSIRVSTRPDYIDPEGLDFLKDWGVGTIELGVQSFANSVLRASRRGYQSEEAEKACLLIRQTGFKLGIQLMIGLPGDSYELDIYSTRKAIEVKPDLVRIYPAVIISGTALEEMYIKGDYIPLSLEDAIKISADMLLQFQKQGIKVIRIGLQPSDELLKPGGIIAGPFHPSFGELVEQEIFKRQAEELIKRFLAGKQDIIELVLLVNPRDVSKMIGSHRQNITYLKKRFNLHQVKVKADPGIGLDTIRLGINEPFSLSRNDYINGRV
jgi:histone acetyltransferase (RNA polymerase elongator complex component)